MDENMREIERFEQAQKDARNPHLREKLRTKVTNVRLTPEEWDEWKKSGLSIPELMHTGLRFHDKAEERRKMLRNAVHAFLSPADSKTLTQARMRAILLKTPLRPSLEEIEATISEMQADRKLEVLYHLL